jgi:hypothetical protein
VKLDPYPPCRPFKRESGVPVRIDESGDELRLHLGEGGRYYAHRWRVDPTSQDGWRGPGACGFSPADIAAMAAAVGYPVLIEKLRVLFPAVHPDVAEWGDDDVCGKCGAMCVVDDGMHAEPGDPCHSCAAEAYVRARALLNL